EPLSHRERGWGEGPVIESTSIRTRTLTRPTSNGCSDINGKRNAVRAVGGGAPSPSGRGEGLAARIAADTTPHIVAHTSAHFHYSISNTDRTIGARLAGEIARRYGDAGLGDATLTLEFDGSAGQSFGAWCSAGMHLILHGEANDGVGKGMAGG